MKRLHRFRVGWRGEEFRASSTHQDITGAWRGRTIYHFNISNCAVEDFFGSEFQVDQLNYCFKYLFFFFWQLCNAYIASLSRNERLAFSLGEILLYICRSSPWLYLHVDFFQMDWTALFKEIVIVASRAVLCPCQKWEKFSLRAVIFCGVTELTDVTVMFFHSVINRQSQS